MNLPQQNLSWHRDDVEQKFGFQGGRFTRVNGWFVVLTASILSVAFYGSLTPFHGRPFVKMFTDRGLTPYFIVFFAAMALSIIIVKYFKLGLQRKSLKLQIVPDDADFILSVATARQVIGNLQMYVDDLRKFILFNRIDIALSNLRNLGRVTDVDEILRSQAESDESIMETSYSLIRGLIWGIPVLGFIGTVLGLSTAIGSFGEVLSESKEIGEITGSLQSVTGGLATAFETTLVALVAALALQFLTTILKKSEEEFLDECNEYCQRWIVGRLRVMPFEPKDTHASQIG